MASWLEDLLANLQTGGAPPSFQPAPAASPFPDYKPAPMGAALWDQIAADEAAANAAADRRNLIGMTRAPIRDLGSMLSPISEPAVSLALGGGIQPPANGQAPFGAVPPSLQMAKEMTAPPQEPAPPAEAVPMPRPRPDIPAPTDMSSQNRPAPAPMAERAAPMGMASPQALGFGDTLKGIAPALLGFGAALQGDGGALTAQLIKRREDQEILQQGRNATAQALLARGAPAQEVAAATRNPELMKALITRYFETKAAQNVGGMLVRERPDGKVDVLFDNSKEEQQKPPSGFRWKDKDKTTLEFIPEGPADPKYLREKGEKNAAPAGYRWIDPQDPDKGLVAIPGGPGEKIDADVAGRLGLAKSFLGQLPDIRRRIEAGEMDGVTGAVTGKLGMGGAGELRRQIDSGAEALLRMLTGAGMNKEEASQYVRRYQFDPTDTRGTRLSKLGQLERELNTVGETVGRGRGGWENIRGVLNDGKGYTAPKSGTIDIGGSKIPWSVN